MKKVQVIYKPSGVFPRETPHEVFSVANYFVSGMALICELEDKEKTVIIPLSEVLRVEVRVEV